MASTNILFDFDNIDLELPFLQQQIDEFQITYQSNIELTSFDNQVEQDFYNQEEFNKLDISNSFILDELILEESISDESILNEEAQYKKLQTIICCKDKFLQNLISHEHAITNYQKFQNLNNNQKDMFLLGILSATVQQETTTNNQKCNRLANRYIFEEIEICNEAFLIIYGIGEKYWKNIQSHFIEQGIRKTSNFAISFETVLEIITFIINYANIHGLPSPDTLSIIFLPSSESYTSLYQLYKLSKEDQDQNIIHKTTFWCIWNKYIPEIKILSPRVIYVLN
ncbi:30186_t:CDS:2, partial [Gigaspora margarita]